MSRPAKAAINVRIPQEQKAELETLAAKEGVNLAEYVRRHFQDLLLAQKIRIPETEQAGMESIIIPNPYWPNQPPQNQYGAPNPYAPFNPYANPYGPVAPTPPNALDQMVANMEKIFVAQMMANVLQGQMSPEQVMRMRYGGGDGGAGFKKAEDDFSFDKMMKWQFFMQQQEREMNRANAQLELARSKGDKQGEQGAMSMITALIASQSAQAQTFLQQMMAVNQNSNQNQMNMFTAAMGATNTQAADKFAMQRETDQRIDTLRDTWNSQQLAYLQQINTIHVDNLKVEMERIRNEKNKDTLSQISDLLKLRQDPVYKAAFDAAFGVSNEGMIEKLIPQLKELGVAPLIDNVGKFLVGMVTRPRVPSPGMAAVPPIPPLAPGEQPAQTPTGTEKLEELSIPLKIVTEKPPQGAAAATGTNTQANIVAEATKREFTQEPTPPENLVTEPQTVAPESAIGYTNLDTDKMPSANKEEKKPNPPEAPQLTTEIADKDFVPTVFTTQRGGGKKKDQGQ